MDWSNETVVVLGGAGFIGSHLVDRLMGLNIGNLEVVDNLSRGGIENVHPQVSFYQNDIGAAGVRDPIIGAPHLIGKVIFHLAAKVTGIHYNASHNLDMMQSNIDINSALTRELVSQADHPFAKGKTPGRNPKLLVWVSTACVYPHDAPVPTPEDAADVCDPEPTNFGYGVAKWVGEQQAKYLCQEYGIPTIIVRFFNAFGPRDYYDEETSHVAPALIRRVMEGENPLVVWGSGRQTRALVDARDIAKALVMLAEKGVGGRRQFDEPFETTLHSTELSHAGVSLARFPFPWIVNIGHEREISIGALADTITGVAYSKFDIPKPTLEFDTSKPDGYPRRAADTTRLRSLIGWVPDMPLEQTLEDMMKDYLYQKEMGRIND